MQTFELEQKILLLDVEEKEKVNIYTFVSLKTNETSTFVGVKKDVSLHKPIIVKLAIKIEKEVFVLASGQKKYVNNSSVFVTGFREDENDD